MTLSVQDCQWPDLPQPYLLALKDAVQYVMATFPTTVGVIASGTIIQGHPDPSSDLDIYVVHLDGYRQRVQKFFRGIPAEIFINPPVAIQRYFHDEGQSRRPLTAHMFATGFVIVQSDPVVSRLQEEAQAILQSQPGAPRDLNPVRYMIATVLEDAVDVSNKDRATARMVLNQAVDQMLRHAFTKVGRYTPRMKDLLGELRLLDPELGRLARRYHRAWSFRRQLSVANELADRTVGARGFFEWQSDPEAVEKQSGQNNSEPT